jgi:hypothetical protein
MISLVAMATVLLGTFARGVLTAQPGNRLNAKRIATLDATSL